MKNDLKISTVAIICVLCTAVSGAYGASSVRSLGGSGTYESASSAVAANNSSTSSVRGGSVRVNPSSGVSGTSTNITAGTTTSGRVATTPRLSIGQYLGGTTSISGGSSLRPQTPSGGGSSSSGGEGGGDFSGLQSQVDQLQRDVQDLRSADDNLAGQLLDKQDVLVPGRDGYIIIDDNTNEIFVDVDSLQDALETVAGQDGREIELGSNDSDLLWRYVGDSSWNILISKSEITGPQGPQGEKGEPGDAANLENYSTTEQMNAAISAAIASIAGVYATQEDFDNLERVVAAKANTVDVNAELAKKANAADVYTKSEVYNKQEVNDLVADVAAGDMEEALKDYVKTDALNTALETKADTTYVDAQLETKADKTSVSALETEVGEINDLATDAALAAENALSGLNSKADKTELNAKENVANKKTTLTNSDTDYPSTSAVTAALANKADKSELTNLATKDEVSTAVGDAIAESGITELGQRVTDVEDTIGTGTFETTDKTVIGAINELKNKTDGIPTEGNFEEMNNKLTQMEQNLDAKQDKSNMENIVSDSSEKYPSSAAVRGELETKANQSDLNAMNEALANKADKSELEGLVTTEDLAGYATTEQLADKVNKSELANYATTEQLGTKADLSTVQQLQATVGNEEAGLVADVASAASAAAAAAGAAETAQQTAEAAQQAAETAQQTAEAANTALAGKQDKLDYTPEDSANKATSINDGNKTSSNAFPSVGAVTEWTEQRISELSTEGLPVNPDQIGTGAITEEKLAADSVSTIKIQDGSVTEAKLSTELKETISGKANADDLGALAYESEISNAQIAADAGIEKSKLAADVQATLDSAVTTTDAGVNKILGTDENGDKVWYDIVFE